MTFKSEPIRVRWELHTEPRLSVEGEDSVFKRFLEFTFASFGDPRNAHNTRVEVQLLEYISVAVSCECKSCGETTWGRTWYGHTQQRRGYILVDRSELSVLGCLPIAEGVCTGLLGTLMAEKVAREIFFRLFIDSPGRHRRWLLETAPDAAAYFGKPRTIKGGRKLDKRLKCHILRKDEDCKTACGRPISKVSKYTIRPLRTITSSSGKTSREALRVHHRGVHDPGYCGACLHAIGQDPPEI